MYGTQDPGKALASEWVGGSPGKLANPQSPIYLPGATAVSVLGKRKAWEEEGGKRRPESPGDCRCNRVLICLLRTKNLPAKQETWVQSLSQENTLEEGMAAHSSILVCKMERGAWQATVHGVTKSQTQPSD